jgi:excisionase family DNA binding protein
MPTRNTPRTPAAEREHPARRLASIETAAAYVDTSPRTIRNYISAGALTGYRLGPRLIRVDLGEIDEMLQRIPTVGGVV